MPDIDLEAGGKPFDAASKDATRNQVAAPGEPSQPSGQPSSSAMAALGLASPQKPTQSAPAKHPMSGMVPELATPPTPSPKPPVAADPNAQANGQQKVEDYSAAIQKSAEEAYAWSLHRVMTDPTALDQMLDSSNPIDRKLAEKILERNAEHFGAGSAEEYRAKKTIDNAGADPRDKELAEIKLNQRKLLQQEEARNWRDWKKDHGIKDDEFGKLCNAVRTEYPKIPESDVVSIARGRAGISPQSFSQLSGVAAAPTGALGSPQDNGADLSPSLSREFNLDTNMVQSATAYFEAIGGVAR